MVDNKKDEITRFVTPSNIDINALSERIDKFEAITKKLEEDTKDIKDIKFQIFSIMALFFGIFSFISIDVSLTKGLFSLSNIDVKNLKDIDLHIFKIPKIYAPAVFILIAQVIFFICIYLFLLRKFFNRNSSFYIIKENKKYKVTNILIALSFVCILIGIAFNLEYMSNIGWGAIVLSMILKVFFDEFLPIFRSNIIDKYK